MLDDKHIQYGGMLCSVNFKKTGMITWPPSLKPNWRPPWRPRVKITPPKQRWILSTNPSHLDKIKSLKQAITLRFYKKISFLKVERFKPIFFASWRRSFFSARSNLSNISKLVPRRFLKLVDVDYLDLSRKVKMVVQSWSVQWKIALLWQIFAQKYDFYRISHSSVLSPVLLKACFACAAPAIISKLFLNRLHTITDVYDGVIVPVLFEFTGYAWVLLTLWPGDMQCEFCVLFMVRETIVCGIVRRDFLGFKKSLQILIQKEKTNCYPPNDATSGFYKQ